MPSTPSARTKFPKFTPPYILSFQFSSWYPQFSDISIRSKIIRPLGREFEEYLTSDGVFVPEGSEDLPGQSTLSHDGSDDDDEEARRFAFPELDARIREVVREYTAVFPKLNFSSPKDASWILPPSSPLKCTSPADIYLLLKSSDFVTHDLSVDTVFEGCESEEPTSYQLELVLRKWYPIDRSRELRCFVRNNILIGISQRDTNYYDFYNDPAIRSTIVSSVQCFWDTFIRERWTFNSDYVFDILLTWDLSRAHVLDFNPYAPRTDPLLFTYDELLDILISQATAPELRVIDSRAHLAANRNAPAHQHNMVPFEVLSISSGRDIEEFAGLWKEEVRRSAVDDSG